MVRNTVILFIYSLCFNFSNYSLFINNPFFIFLDYQEIVNKINTCEEYDRECFDKFIYDKMNTVYNGSVLHENKLMICFILLFIKIICRMILLKCYLFNFRKFIKDENLFPMGEDDVLKCNDLFRSCRESIKK